MHRLHKAVLKIALSLLVLVAQASSKPRSMAECVRESGMLLLSLKWHVDIAADSRVGRQSNWTNRGLYLQRLVLIILITTKDTSFHFDFVLGGDVISSSARQTNFPRSISLSTSWSCANMPTAVCYYPGCGLHKQEALCSRRPTRCGIRRLVM